MTAPALLQKQKACIVIVLGSSCFQPDSSAGDTDAESGASTSTSQGVASASETSTGSTGMVAVEESGSEDVSTSDAEITSTSTAEGAETESSESGDIVAPPNCGDGNVDADEECDDGNDDDTDACTSVCRFPTCGDGWIQEANDEVCELDEISEGSCWGEGEQWGGVLGCSSACDAITTDSCHRWQAPGPRLTHGIELGVRRLEFDDEGNAHMLYGSRDAAENSQVYTVRYDAESMDWNTAIPHVRVGGGVAEPFYVQSSDLAVTPTGVAFVAYSVAQGGMTPYDVYVARFDPEAGLWEPPVRLGSGNYVALDVPASEQAMVVWQDADYQATYSQYTPQTGAWSSATRLSTSLDSLYATGIFVRDDGQAFSLTTSGGRVYLSAFQTEWTHTPLTPSMDSHSPAPIAGAAREGSALLGVRRIDGDGAYEVVVWILDSAAGVVGESTTITNASGLMLAMGRAGHGAVMYSDNFETSYLRRLLPGARAFEAPIELPELERPEHLTIDSSGNIFVFHTSNSPGPLRAVRFDAAAEAWSEVYDVFVPGDGLYVNQARSDIDDAGHLIVAMAEGPGGRWPDNHLFFRHLR